ncbi:MAG: hypothetical protein EOO04_10160 [Chitinophagaceae bacterium]|nr:MAG: hypothetical protein EOO04_10160 [Chitinophagaceae bacterium]
MAVRQFAAAHRKTINWASGTSTEIFIHPSTGSFAARDFIFRISTATVEAEESTFTLFTGITRHLMILHGNLELIHEGRYNKLLKPYDQDIFSGEWNTRSKGKVTDFNLMLKGGAGGSLRHERLKTGTQLRLEAATEFHFIYVASGTAGLENGSITNPGDLLWPAASETIMLEAKEDTDLVIIEVSLTGDNQG